MSFLERFPLLREKKCRIDINVSEWIASPPPRVGPLLMYIDTDIHSNTWKGSVMFIVREDTPDPELHLEIEANVTGGAFCNIHPFRFFKWTLQIPQQSHTIRVPYQIVHGDWKVQHTFFVAGMTESWRFGIFSCNGLSHTSGYKGYAEKYGGIHGMWADLIHRHHSTQFHAMLGIGDQIYMDCVWEHTKSLDKWTRIPSRVTRETMQTPDGLAEEVDRWVLHFYLYHFDTPYFREALAKIPYIMLSGDHDLTDGIGSYPEALENCNVMKTFKGIVLKYYLLFQLHVGPHESDIQQGCCTTTKDRKVPYIGKQGYSFVKNFGDRVRVMGLDTRLERTRKHIVCNESYDMVFDALRQNFEESDPKPIHLLVLVEIPIIAPDLRKFEKLFDWVSQKRRGKFITKVSKRMSTFKKIGFPFSEPVLLTDMIDHWNSNYHIKERDVFLERLQKFSADTGVRVTFVSGDIHVAGMGRFATPSSADDRKRRHYENNMILPYNYESDTRLMYQIITSAIGNVPPPSWVVKGYHLLDYPETITTEFGETDSRMLRLFKRSTSGKVFGKRSKKLMGLRNWCSCEYIDTDDSLFFELLLEIYIGANKTMKYNMLVPALDSNISRSA